VSTEGKPASKTGWGFASASGWASAGTRLFLEPFFGSIWH
jgi:hypothetical protein